MSNPLDVAKSDLELAAAIRQRDRKATARFVELYSDAVYRYVWRRLFPRTEAVPDLVQDVFVAAWRALPGYQGDAALQNWVLGIARNKVEDYYRRTLRDAQWLTEGIDTEEAETAPAAVGLSAEGMIDAERDSARASRILDDLPYEYAIVLRWKYWDGRSSLEMAEGLGKTVKAVERLLARARAQFGKQWLNDGKGKEEE
ncbi:RNA polymerase sigma factor [Bryobacterales bacterium F-183]|nr:RNA polymerase sigma factor [Bryobacterales bacterium F-183]